jgi:hypothetical protein
MLDAQKVLVIIRHPQRRNDLVAELFQFRREHSIKLRRQYLQCYNPNLLAFLRVLLITSQEVPARIRGILGGAGLGT